MDWLNAATLTGLYVASEWVIRIIMLIVVPFRRSPDAAKGWLLLLFFLPWPGLILYHLIGRPTYPKTRNERFAQVPGAFKHVVERLARSPHITHPKLHPEMDQAATLVRSLGRMNILGGNTAELLHDYDESVDALVRDIDAATNNVHLLFYIFADDATGMKVIDALGRARKRGVTCRVLVDDLGSRKWMGGVKRAMAAADVEMYAVLPVKLIRRGSARADLRNHRKIAVIDGRAGFTGSQNLVDAEFKKGIHNEEMVVRVTGPVVLELQAVFAIDWFMETGQTLDSPELFPEPKTAGEVTAQVLPSGPDYPAAGVQRLVTALVHGARKRVVLTTPYFIPDDALVQAMQTAVQRGVEVHLVVSKQADQILVSLAQKSYYAELLAAGVKIHLYSTRFLHAKHLSIDDAVALIGSSNIDIRSFVLNSEVSMICYDQNVAMKQREQQERYFEGSELLNADEWRTRSLFEKTCENLARLASPLL